MKKIIHRYPDRVVKTVSTINLIWYEFLANKNKKEVPENLYSKKIIYSLGAICVLPASIVIWVGSFRDFALPCYKTTSEQA